MSRCPLSISPSIVARLSSFAAKLPQQARNIDDVPVLGKLAVFDAPDVDGGPGDPLAGGRNALDGPGMGCAQGCPRDDAIAAEDAVLDPGLEIRPILEDALIVGDLRLEP